jgi:hypothetical protein
MLKRIKRFILDHPIDPPSPIITALALDVDNAIVGVDDSAATQIAGGGEVSGGVRTKQAVADDLREYLKDVARVGRTLEEETHPGVAAKFVLPSRRSYAVLLAGARAMIEEATAVQAELTARGLSATFLAELTARTEALENGAGAKIGGMQEQVGGTAALTYRASQGIKAARKLDAFFRAHYRNDPVTLAVWKHARRIEVANAPSPAVETPPPSGEGGTGGTGGGDAGSGSGA